MNYPGPILINFVDATNDANHYTKPPPWSFGRVFTLCVVKPILALCQYVLHRRRMEVIVLADALKEILMTITR